MTLEGFNEMAQWLSLVILLFMTLAVYRRLGLMFMDAREQKLHQFGPRVGRSATSLLSAFPPLTDGGYRLVVFTREGCSLCVDLLKNLGTWGPVVTGGISVSVAAGGAPSYVNSTRDLYPTFAVLPLESVEAAYGSVPTSVPFTFLLDDEMTVVTKVLGPDLHAIEHAYDLASMGEPVSLVKSEGVQAEGPAQ